MPIKKYRPTSPGRRFMSVSAFDEVTTTKKPEKRLLVSLKTDAGLNAQGKSGQVVRAAGMSAQLLAREGDYAQIRMPSGEVRRVAVICYATIGQIGNVEHENENVGKAGKSRWRGKRPAVRGVTMNPFDHPHGGGEGRSGPGGNPKTPWGKPALGYRTRRHKKTKNMLVRRRPPKRKSKG